MNLETFPWLSSIVLLPLIGALIMPFLSSKEGEDNTLPRNISLSFLFIDFLLIIGVLFQKFDTSNTSLQLVERITWLPSIGLEWSLGVDGLSAPLVALSGFITFLSALASRKIKKKAITNMQRLRTEFNLNLLRKRLGTEIIKFNLLRFYT